MKLLIAVSVLSAFLFAGGEIRSDTIVYQKPIQNQNCYKPNIQKCPDCEDVAELCPYNGEELPEAETEPCEGNTYEQQYVEN
jgi:hypothetical protein